MDQSFPLGFLLLPPEEIPLHPKVITFLCFLWITLQFGFSVRFLVPPEFVVTVLCTHRDEDLLFSHTAHFFVPPSFTHRDEDLLFSHTAHFLSPPSFPHWRQLSDVTPSHPGVGMFLDGLVCSSISCLYTRLQDCSLLRSPAVRWENHTFLNWLFLDVHPPTKLMCYTEFAG